MLIILFSSQYVHLFDDVNTNVNQHVNNNDDADENVDIIFI